MSDPLDITETQARQIVLDQSRKAGWVPPALRASQNAEAREAIDILDSTKETLGQQLAGALEMHVSNLATSIYSTRGRYILELIQNVEDCSFSYSNTPPWMSFEITPQHIIVESNQDGFRASDVSQICQLGSSWKRGIRGFVGEKGIGFKSVFKVASKVEIQSNAFSFFLQYDGGNSGQERLRMITPLLGDAPIPADERPLTRMTLALNGNTPYSDLVSDFKNIPQTLLLFLRKLTEIRFKIRGEDGAVLGSYKFVKFVREDGVTCIFNVEEGSPPVEWQYHVVKRVAQGLPSDPERPNINECEMVLAFPIDKNGRPRPHTGYDVYAFLPVCQVGFEFLLQADFLLQANRQEVIIESEWNMAIIFQAARAFCQAMLTFCARPTLRFLWMRYLPVGGAFDRNPLWKAFVSEVISVLKSSQILYLHDSSGAYHETLLREPNEVRALPGEYLDRYDQPLFADRPGTNRKYLSLNYDNREVEMLKGVFRLKNIEDLHMFYRLKQDLDSATSKMKALETDNDWHSRAAYLILSITTRSSGIKNMISDQLDLLPLSIGHWTTAASDDIRFPYSDGPDIPPDLVVTVDHQAAKNTARRELFMNLGVDGIQPPEVTDRLWRSYAFPNEITNLEVSKKHLAFLFWHHRNIEDPRFSKIQVFDHHLRKSRCHQGLIYIPSEDEYGPKELLKAVPDPEDPLRLVPECAVAFLHSEYMDLFPPNTIRGTLTWSEWLERALRIRRVPRMKYDLGSLSPEFRHILRYRPEMTVKFLEQHWREYRIGITAQITSELSQAQVRCHGGSLSLLSDTYFPTSSLIERAQMLEVPSKFPFLVASGLIEENIEDWRFLERFGVRFSTSLTFYLDILKHHKRSSDQIWSSGVRAGILDTYAFIADECNEASRQTVITAFQRDGLILHPSSFRSGAIRPEWLDVQSCLWRGPKDLLDKTPLATVSSYSNSTSLRRLFCEVLSIPNASWHDYLEMLLKLRRSQDQENHLSAKVLQIYKLLSESNLSTEQWETVFNKFENNDLIFIPTGPSWFAPSRCVWASPVQIPGKAIVGASYSGDMKDFFQIRFKISPAALSTLVEGLCTLANRQPPVSEVKQMIWAINGMDPKQDDLLCLRNCDILPVRIVRHGIAGLSLRNRGSNFAVNDRAKLADIFANSATLLDFSLEEVRQLEPFLTAFNLGEKYLSRTCVEETACSDEGQLDTTLKSYLQDRAYYLLRCAVSSRSPLTTGGPNLLFGRLQATTVLISDGISTQHTLRYPSGDSIGPVSQSHGHVHIDEDNGNWKIFVPRDKHAREICYRKKLPYAFATLLKINMTAIESLGHVLNSSIGIIDELLDEGGIAKIPGLEPPAPLVDGELHDDENLDFGVEEEVVSEVTAVSSMAIRRTFTSLSDSSSESSSRPRTPPEPSRIPRPAYVGYQAHFTVDAYTTLLGNVIRIARRTLLPHRNHIPNINGHFHPGFNRNATFGVRAQGQMNHDFKIGAAGELFVYEFLLKRNLPSFGFHNWTSTIRNLVTSHPEYSEMGPWPGRREISDLNYRDVDSILTKYLIEAGYLDEEVWSGKTPEYLIEVKTTTGLLGDRFFVSDNQYRLMETLTLRPGQSAGKIYVVFRVYNLGKDTLNVHLYVDPIAQRGTTLKFESHTWTVTPLRP